MEKSLSDKIRSFRGGVVNNPYQGKDKKVVFVCSMGLLRSATGARLYAHKYNTRSAGSYSDALIPLTPMLIAWADEIVFVNKHNYMQCLENFGENAFDDVPTLKVLSIPDSYPHMDPSLVKAFSEQYEEIPDAKTTGSP